ncbi:MAG: shikimate kinase [Isosphaeraceae bacterium]
MSLDVLTPRGIALVGYRGTGKSTVGRLLAERLNRPFVDADAELEARAGLSIPAIFQQSGEPAFRDQEERLLAELAMNPAHVLATGGGIVLRETNRRALKQYALVVWLTAPAELIRERLRSDPDALAGRPALTAAGTLEEIEALLSARASLYREVADAVVSTVGSSPHDVARKICSWIAQGQDPRSARPVIEER